MGNKAVLFLFIASLIFVGCRTNRTCETIILKDSLQHCDTIIYRDSLITFSNVYVDGDTIYKKDVIQRTRHVYHVFYKDRIRTKYVTKTKEVVVPKVVLWPVYVLGFFVAFLVIYIFVRK